MKKLLLVFVVCVFASACNCDKKEHQSEIVNEMTTEPIVDLFDSVLAKQYEADQYGMKSYVMAFLKTGPNRDIDSLTANEIFMGHMRNIERMAEEGTLVLAGPFVGEGSLRGIYVFDVRTIAEAEQLTNSDPAIQSGYLTMELKKWYGSAALMGLNKMHSTISKSSVSGD